MKSETVDAKMKKVGSLDLNEYVWSQPFNEDLVAQCVFVYRSNLRSGDASAKTRGEVSGGGRKPWRQKGTGRARSGSNRSPLWVGGGVTFVPSNRNWSKRLNKGMKAKALAVMLSKRLKDGAVAFVEGLNGVERDQFAQEKNVLMVADDKDLYLKFRNVKGVSVVAPTDLNVMDVVGSKKVVFDKESVAKLEGRLGNE